MGYRTSEGMQEALNSTGPLGPNPHPPPCKLIAQRSSASITQGVVQDGGFSQSGPSHNSEDHEMIMISLARGLLLHFMYVQSVHELCKRGITLKPELFAFG